MSDESKITIREGCPYGELNRDNGIICIPMDLCHLCKRKTMTPEERAE